VHGLCQRVGEAVAPSLSVSGGSSAFRDNPQAPPPRITLLFTKVGARAPVKANKCLPSRAPRVASANPQALPRQGSVGELEWKSLP